MVEDVIHCLANAGRIYAEGKSEDDNGGESASGVFRIRFRNEACGYV